MEYIWLPDSIKKVIQGKNYVLNQVGMSGSKVFIFDDMVLKIQSDSAEADNEYRVCNWLRQRIPTPDIIEYKIVDGSTYCLMSRIEGKMLCEEFYLTHPLQLLEIVVQAMKMLWTVDIADCPCDNSLDVKLKMARYYVENNLVDLDHVEPETFGENGFSDPFELLDWLEKNRPDEELVFSYGDFSLPNIFADNGKVSGFIDLGKMGVADRWQDIAICFRSLKNNFAGKYQNGVSYGGCNLEMLFEKLGVEVDDHKLRYYSLLDELF